MNDITKEMLVGKIKFHKDFGIPYTIEKTGSRIIFKSQRGEYVCRKKEFIPKELSFIKSVKHNIIKNEIYNDIPNNFKTEKDKDKIKYVSYNKKYDTGDYIENVKEIDLKSAYWETSNYTGLLTPEIYLKGGEVSKQSRLAAIGSLAKKVKTISFDGRKESYDGIKRSELTEFLWDVISHKVGQVMLKGVKASKNDYLFFWVDAIFVRGESVDRIVKLFADLGYNSSVHHCEWVKFEDDTIVVHSEAKGKYKERNGEKVWIAKRPFPFKEVISDRQRKKMEEYEKSKK